MDEKLNTTSRWLTALAVVLIPLTVIAIVSGAWGLNYQFDTSQWTRYLLFASWITLTISVIAGLANMINSPEEDSSESAPAALAGEGLSPDEGDEEETSRRVPEAKNSFNASYAFLFAQACTFALGIILYVTYISWMILGLQSYPSVPGL